MPAFSIYTVQMRTNSSKQSGCLDSTYYQYVTVSTICKARNISLLKELQTVDHILHSQVSKVRDHLSSLHIPSASTDNEVNLNLFDGISCLVLMISLGPIWQAKGASVRWAGCMHTCVRTHASCACVYVCQSWKRRRVTGDHIFFPSFQLSTVVCCCLCRKNYHLRLDCIRIFDFTVWATHRTPFFPSRTKTPVHPRRDSFQLREPWTLLSPPSGAY